MLCNQSERRRRSQWQIDFAIHQSLATLDAHRTAQSMLARLALHVRAASSLLRADPESGRPGWVDAVHLLKGLAALSRECRYWRSAPEAWTPPVAGRMRQFCSLASHLFGGTPVPACMLSAWFEAESTRANRHRMWFRHLAAGHSLRGLGLPIETAAPMQRFLHEAPHHLTIEQALAWITLRAEGIDPQAALDRVDPRRNDRHRCALSGKSWIGIGLRGYVHSEPYAGEWHVRTWEIRELLDSRDLEQEADSLHHCVDLYAEACRLGRTSIWSLSCTDHRGSERRELTIQVNPRTRTIVQARTKWDQKPTSAARRIMLLWAKREGLRVNYR